MSEKIKIKVKSRFVDKFQGNIYSVGQELEFDPERAKDVVDRGLAELVKEPEKEPTKEPATEPAKEPAKEPVKEPQKEPAREPEKKAPAKKA